MRIKFPLASLFLISICPLVSVAQQPKPKVQSNELVATYVSPKEAKEIRRLLDLTGETTHVDLLIDQSIAEYKRVGPKIPAAVWTEIGSEMKKELTADKLADLLIPIYAQHFTPVQIRALSSFFGSPIGEKWTQELPKIQSESYSAGFVFGKVLGERIRDSLKMRGYSVPIG